MSATSTLLQQLRNGCHRWEDDPEQGMLLLMKHQSEFPVKIRNAIRQATLESAADASNASRMLGVYNVVSSFFLCTPENEDENSETKTEEEEAQWTGPDCEIDTQEEIELTIRTFPKVLRETRSIDEIWEWDFFPIFWMTTCLKSLPFVPLLAELGSEYQLFGQKEQGGILNAYQIRKGSPLLQIVTNKFILQNHLKDDHEFNQLIDNVSLSVLARLKEKGFLKKKDAWDCIENLLNETPSRTERRLQFFLQWDPGILHIKDNRNVALFKRRFSTSLLEEFLNQCSQSGGHVEDGMFERFQALFELGLRHYPKQIGFLFHKDDRDFLFHGDEMEVVFEPAYRVACRIFGEKKVARLVNECILKHTGGRSGAIRKLIFTAATNEKILFDGLFFLVRRDPSVVIPFLMKDNSEKKPMPVEPMVMHRTIEILIFLVFITGTAWAWLRLNIPVITDEL